MSAAAELCAPAPESSVQASGIGTGVQLISDVAQLDALKSEWQRLADEARAGTMFLTYEWLRPWWDHFGGGRELSALAVFDGGALIGFWPLMAERARYGGVEVKRLAFVGDGATGCDHMDLLAAPGREHEVLSACLDKLAGLEWDLLDLDGMLRDAPTVIELAQRHPAMRESGGTVRDGKLRFVCPHIPLRGTHDQYLEGLGRRENLRRREKWLFKQPGVWIECVTDPARTPTAMEHFFHTHDARWAPEGGSDGLPDARFPPFHRAAAQLLAERGRLRMYTLFAARRPVATVYGVTHGRTFFYYQSGYEPLWGAKSVGLVLLARTVKDAFDVGLSDFDFLRGNESYKADWARAERWTVQTRLWRGKRGRAARMAELVTNGAREAVKAALPDVVKDSVKKARRLLRTARGGDEA
jgi:CelD/BcsL family acetyltransferase involved in cellulose biosynthesis